MSRIKRLPSPALIVAVVALVMAMGGGAYAATTLGGNAVHTRNIANHAVTNIKLGNGSVGYQRLNGHLRYLLGLKNGQTPITGKPGPAGPQGPKGDTGPAGPAGPAGGSGANGSNGGGGGGGGASGQNGLNPAVPVVNVPAISAGGTNPAGNPDSGAAGDQGFYFSGNGAGGSAQLTNGELEVSGPGVDSNTFQGGIGIAKFFNGAKLSTLSDISYDYHVNVTNGTQAPTIHITVSGATADSKFASGFTNLTYNPGINGITPLKDVQYQADTVQPGAVYYSTAEGAGGVANPNAPGGQNNPRPLSYFLTNDPNATITQISLDNGGTSGGTGTFDAGADNLIIGFGGSNTRYDLGG